MLGANVSTVTLMKTSQSSRSTSIGIRILCAVTCLFPTLLLAHPGHYHPDETDEFDFFRATLMHSHGALDVVLAVVVILCLALTIFGTKPGFRLGAIAAGLGSLSLMSVF